MKRLVFLSKTIRLSLLFCAVALTVFGCSDDTEANAQNNGDDTGQEEQEISCNTLNTEINTLRLIIDAQYKDECVTDISPITEDENIKGYTFFFSGGNNVTVYNRKDNQNTVMPIIGVKQDSDKEWFWTIDGEWLLINGSKVNVASKDEKIVIVPQLKIKGNSWYISYDGGKNWESEPLGIANVTSEQEIGSLFDKVEYDDEHVYISMSGQAGNIVLPFAKNETQKIEIILDQAETTCTSASISGHLKNVTESDLASINITIRYSDKEDFNAEDESLPSITVKAIDFGPDNSFKVKIRRLNAGKKYNYCTILNANSNLSYGEIRTFLTDIPDIQANVIAESITATSAVIKTTVSGLDTDDIDLVEAGVLYSAQQGAVLSGHGTEIKADTISENGSFQITLSGLPAESIYYCCAYLKINEKTFYSEEKNFSLLQADSWAGKTVWIYGLTGIPDPDTWKKVDNIGAPQYGLEWNDAYGWFDCNKLDPNGTTDSKLCWAASVSNMIHWWMRFNEHNISRYGRYSGPEAYYKSSTDEGIFAFFRNSFYNNGNPVCHGLNWFFTGLNQFQGYWQSPKEELNLTAGYFKDVLGENVSISDYYQYFSASFFEEKMKLALSCKKCISIAHDYAGIPHAINVWGADFDASGKICAIYVTDNNDIDYEKNKAPLTPAGLIRRKVGEKNGKMYMQNWQGNLEIEIYGITLLDLMTDKWDAYFQSL